MSSFKTNELSPISRDYFAFLIKPGGSHFKINRASYVTVYEKIELQCGDHQYSHVNMKIHKTL
jgi:hypothetical protein